MADAELWSTLVSAIDPAHKKAMPAVLQSTIDLLESELVKAKAALREIQPNVAATAFQRDELAVGAMTAYRQHLIGRAPDFYGSRHLSPKEIGLVPVVHEVASDTDESDDGEQPQPIVTLIPSKRNSLVDVLSNSLVLDHMAPYLSVSSLLALAATSRLVRSTILETPYVFRHLDLSRCRGAQILGATKSNEPVDEDLLTEDEFYSAPLRGIFNNLARRSILQGVRTLVLDGLPVPTDLVADIMLTDQFNVNVLSIRDCRHLNERKLMQVLQYAVRPTRPPGTPRVKAIYHFSPMDNPHSQRPARPRYRDWWSSRCQNPSPTAASPPTNEEQLVEEGSTTEQQNEWYLPSGQLLKNNIEEEWAQTIKKCEGVIAFDAVLCRGPRHNVDLFSSTHPPPDGGLLGPSIATVALGPQGCDGCHSSPEGPAVWGQSALEHFPLLTPLPLHSSSVVSAKRPMLYPDPNPALIARCTECLTNRRCNRCNKWFCSSCLPQPVRITANLSPHQTAVQGPRSTPSPEQVNSQALERGVSKDCWECGPTVRIPQLSLS